MTPEPQKEFDCIYYPMCHKAYELLYCPKKARGDVCEDYRPYNPHQEREKVLDEVFQWVDQHPFSIRKDGYEYYRVSRNEFAKKIAELRSRGGGG